MHTEGKRSKRSSRVKLTTMAALSSGVVLSACGSDPAPEVGKSLAEGPKTNEVQVFENVFACAKATGKSREECETMRKEAADKAAKEAPRYQAKQDCEAEWGEGKCAANDVASNTTEESSSSGRRHFSPFIVAWFSSSKKGTGPLYSSRNGGYQTANGARLGYGGAPGKYMASDRAFERTKSVPKVKPASKMAIASGFGSRNSPKATGFTKTGSAASSSRVASRGG
ncbi:MAG: DUF1190 domain-containing protein [Pseudomonadota bacterium]|nr:DUF1190 domain-containing protein [Pseudomonadota bacterium]